MEYDFLNIKDNNIAPSAGRILISEPFSKDTYFKRSVVLLTDHNKQGSIGFILNKTVLEMRVSDLLADFTNINIPVSFGGPVQTDTVHYIHSYGKAIPNSLKVKEDIWWGGDIDHIRLLAEAGELDSGKIRFFVGYSGWGPDQLLAELKSNFWLVANTDAKTVFRSNPEEGWSEILKNMDSKYRIWTTFPENPELN